MARGAVGGAMAMVCAWVGLACASPPAPGIPSVPAPIPEPVPHHVPLPGLDATGEGFLLAEPGPVVHDAILASKVARDPEFQREVERWVEFWRTRARRSFPESLDRMSWFGEAVNSTIERKGLPPSLRYLPIIESGYHPGAVSPARAAGMWQFMEPTARIFGMGVSPLVDERRDPLKSTEAATEYLGRLHSQFGSWFMALAAYNAGPSRVRQILDRHAPLRPPTDSLLWSLRRHLPRETQEYIPKFFAAATVAGDPEAHGFAIPNPSSGFAFDQVTVPDATTLDVVASAAGVTVEEIQRLNPELLRGMTPPGVETVVRVPAGTGEGFRERYDLIPPGERVSFVEHRVVSGETLSYIARRYGVPLGELQAANAGVNPRALRIGQRLTVPISARGRARPTGTD